MLRKQGFEYAGGVLRTHCPSFVIVIVVIIIVIVIVLVIVIVTVLAIVIVIVLRTHCPSFVALPPCGSDSISCDKGFPLIRDFPL